MARPHQQAKEIIEVMKKSFKVLIKRPLAYKVKSEAHKKLHRPMKDHYAKIGRYLKGLEAVNPKSMFTLVTDAKIISNPPTFQRL